MDFDGAIRKEGSGIGVWVFNSQTIKSRGHSYKLNFQCRNNIAEYEALILGLQLLKKLGAKIISVHGNFELIIKPIKGQYSSKHPMLRAYRNIVIDFLEFFLSMRYLYFEEVKTSWLLVWLLQLVRVKCLFSQVTST